MDISACTLVNHARSMMINLPERLPDPATVPGVEAAIAAGFTPLETFTGNVEIGEAWPIEHSRAFPDPRCNEFIVEMLGPDADDDEPEILWLVRSPWPSISIEAVMDQLWKFVVRTSRTIMQENALSGRAELLSLVKDFFDQPEAKVRARVNRSRRSRT